MAIVYNDCHYYIPKYASQALVCHALIVLEGLLQFGLVCDVDSWDVSGETVGFCTNTVDLLPAAVEIHSLEN